MNDAALVFSTKTTAKAVLPLAVLYAAREGTLPPEDAATLAELGFLVESDERAEMADCIADLNRRRNGFHGIVMLNLDCNLDCPYCFERDIRGASYMSREIAEKVATFIASRYAIPGNNITIDFYGGEALLSMHTLKMIARPLRDLTKNIGAEFSFNLVTNGTLLTRSVAEELVPLGLKKARLTLDGPPETHNRSRPFANGAGSFDIIADNILDVADLVQVQIGGNFTRDNYREFPRLLDILIERGISPEKLAGVQFAPVISQQSAGCRDASEGCVTGTEEWVTEALVFLREEIMRRGYRAPKIEPSVCFAEYDNDVVIAYDGTMYKCPGLVGRQKFAVGRIPEGPCDLDRYKLDIWKTEECLECKYLPLCFGGCRYLRVLQTGEIDGVDCRKDFYAAALDELLLQELRYDKNA